jgi:acyl-CoA thioesterase FadM
MTADEGAAATGWAAAPGAPARGLSPAVGITVGYRVRFDECGPDGTARASTLLRYAQDMAWLHSEQRGFDREWYLDRGLTWVVRAAELALLRPVALGTTIAVSTRVAGVRRVWARRRTEMCLPDGTLALWAHTDWVIIDARGLPARIPAEFADAFEQPPGGFEPGRVVLAGTPPGAAVARIEVRPQDIDPLAHVNNAAYVDYLDETLLGAGEAAAGLVTAPARTIRIEYALPAQPRATLAAATWPVAVDGRSGWAWRLADADGSDVARALVLAGA